MNDQIGQAATDDVDSQLATNNQDGNSPPRLHCGVLFGTIAAFLGGLLTWAILMAILPVFAMPEELANLEPPQPPEKVAAQELAMATANGQNAILALAILALVLSVSLALVEAWRRSALVSAVWRCPSSGAIAAVFGAGAGLLGAVVFASLKDTSGLSPLAKTIAVQGAMLGFFGLGIGISVAFPYARLRLLLQCAGGGVLGGLLAALIYPIAVGYLLPEAQTERVLPKDGTILLILISFVTVLITLVLTGLGKKTKAR